MVLQLHIGLAKLSDHQRILEFLQQEFYPDEAITLAHPIPGVTKDDEAFTMSHLEGGVVLMAFANDNLDDLVGVLIAGPIFSSTTADNLMSGTVETKKWADILKLLLYIEDKADACRRFKVAKSLQIHVVAVHHDFRGHKIGQKLFRRCFEVAQDQLYKLISVDCTSLYSIKIAKQLEMEFVSEVTYDEYHNYIEEIIFRPEPKHTMIQTFIKKV